jgi:hypothetical protein
MKNKNASGPAVFLTLVLTGVVIPTAAQAQEAESIILFANDTGAEITALVLSPAKEVYPRNRNRHSPHIQVNDKAVFAVELPDHLKGITSWDIEVVSGNKRLTTQRGVRLDFENGAPFLELTEVRRNSRSGPVGALLGSVATAIFMTETRAGRAFQWKVFTTLPPQWRGVVVLLIPVAAGAAGYFAGNAAEGVLIPGILGVQVAYSN